MIHLFSIVQSFRWDKVPEIIIAFFSLLRFTYFRGMYYFEIQKKTAIHIRTQDEKRREKRRRRSSSAEKRVKKSRKKLFTHIRFFDMRIDNTCEQHAYQRNLPLSIHVRVRCCENTATNTHTKTNTCT